MRMMCMCYDSLLVRCSDEDDVYVLWQSAGERQWWGWCVCVMTVCWWETGMRMMCMCYNSLLVRGSDEDPADYSTCIHLTVKQFPSEYVQALNASDYFYVFSGKYIICFTWNWFSVDQCHDLCAFRVKYIYHTGSGLLGIPRVSRYILETAAAFGPCQTVFHFGVCMSELYSTKLVCCQSTALTTTVPIQHNVDSVLVGVIGYF